MLDPGPEDEAHIYAILKAIAGETLEFIILTHTHKDHSSAIASLKNQTGAKLVSHAPIHENRGCRRVADEPLDDKFVDFTIRPDIAISDGDVIEGDNWQLKAIHTPGHAPDHLCFAHSSEPVLFTGDHVMAWNTSVIIPPEGRMSDYLNSLKKLLNGDYERLLPGHGGQAKSPDRLVKAYLMHRKWREDAIFDKIKSGLKSVDELIPHLYPHIDENVKGAAALSILAHAEHLVEQNLVAANTEAAALNTLFHPI